MSPTVLLADDHIILRQGLRTMLEQQVGIRVVAEADDGLQAVELATKHAPDVLIMDIHMPNLNGIEATRRIAELAPQTRIIALSMFPRKRFVTEMLKAGAKGYILKDCAFDELVQAIAEVMAGGIYLSHEISDVVIKDYIDGLHGQKGPLDALTSREREIMQRLVEGQSSKEIATELHLSPKTVDVHRHNIMRKLNCDSFAQLMKYALSEGVISI